MDDHFLEEIARGQQERTVKDISAKNHLTRVKTLSKTMWRNPGIRTEALMLDDEGNPSYYTGQARQIMAIKDLFTVVAAARLLAAVSIDVQLAQKRNRTALHKSRKWPMKSMTPFLNTFKLRQRHRPKNFVTRQRELPQCAISKVH